jgi:hypothetical protein
MSPTQRSLKYLRELGYLVEIVEKSIPKTFIKKDLFGFADLLAIRKDEVLLVQVTSGSNVSARVKKITDNEHLPAVREAGMRVEVQGWTKKADGKYHIRVIDLS